MDKTQVAEHEKSVRDRDYEAFISYRHKECNDLAKAIHNVLAKDYAVNSFRDDEELHFGDFREQLVINNKKSKYLILLLTPRTLERCSRPGDWITKEISLFLERKKPIIPVKLLGFEYPDNLPPEIQGLLEHDCNSIRCDISDPLDAAQYIASRVHSFIRREWKEKYIFDCISKKPYLSKYNKEPSGYYAVSANRLRNTVFFLIPNLAVLFLYIFNCFRIENGSPVYIRGFEAFPYVFSIFILLLLFLERKKVNDSETGRPVLFSIQWMDRSEIGALAQIWGWIIFFAFLGVLVSLIGIFAVIIASIGVDSFLFGQKATNAMGNSDRLYDLMTIANFLILSLLPTIRLSINAVLELCHFINSIFTKYPKRYLNWLKINKIQKIWKIVGWILLVPTILGLGILSLYVKLGG